MPAANASASFSTCTGAPPPSRPSVSTLELESFHLRQVRRLLDDAVADDAGKPDADGVQRLLASATSSICAQIVSAIWSAGMLWSGLDADRSSG